MHLSLPTHSQKTISFWRLIIRILCITTVCFIVWAWMFPKNAAAQVQPDLKFDTAKITNIAEEITNENGVEQLKQTITLQLQTSKEEVETIVINPTDRPTRDFSTGDTVYVNKLELENETRYFIEDFVRQPVLLWVFIIFVILTILISRWQGIASLVALGISFLIVYEFLLPGILNQQSPLVLALISSILIVPINYYLAHGITKKTSIAVVSTVLTITVVLIIALIALDQAHLSGLTNEGASFLSIISQQGIRITDILLAGIVIGVIGILDDITISQASIAYQLKSAKPTITFAELYKRTLAVGRDHIASLVNTLILVYASAALPLLVLLRGSTEPLLEDLNDEQFAEEIIRMLITSIGLILAVPITTFIAAIVYTRFPFTEEKDGHHHVH